MDVKDLASDVNNFKPVQLLSSEMTKYKELGLIPITNHEIAEKFGHEYDSKVGITTVMIPKSWEFQEKSKFERGDQVIKTVSLKNEEEKEIVQMRIIRGMNSVFKGTADWHFSLNFA